MLKRFISYSFLSLATVGLAACSNIHAETQSAVKSAVKSAEMVQMADAMHGSLSKEKAMELMTLYGLLSGTASAEQVKENYAEDWKSYHSNDDYYDREGVIGFIQNFRKSVPDLTWEIKQLYIEGNTVIVRGEATGTPQGDTFFGSPIPGGKSFKVMSIDIHTIEDDKVVTSYHIEDWLGAVRQASEQ